jgi:hypothetical protein
MKSLLLMLALCAVAAPDARAADAHVESFETSLNGWLSTNEGGSSGSWSWTNGYARLRFAASGAPFDLTISSLYATSNSSGGRFAGDYHTVGVPIVGFDFFCENAVPPLVYIALSNSLGRIDRYLLPDEGSISTQSWYRVIIPFSEGAWFPATNVPIVLSNVQTFSIAFRKPVPPNQVHHIRLDNIFLSALHQAQSIGLSSGAPVVVWGPLRTGTVYRTQRAADVFGPWISNSVFAATNAVQVEPLGIATGAHFWRIRAPVLAPL